MVDVTEHLTRFVSFPLLLPESSQAGGSTEFPEFCLLALGYTDGVMETDFGFDSVVWRLLYQECTLEAVEFGLTPAFTRGVHERQRFCQQRESRCWPPEDSMNFREQREPIRSR